MRWPSSFLSNSYGKPPVREPSGARRFTAVLVLKAQHLNTTISLREHNIWMTAIAKLEVCLIICGGGCGVGCLSCFSKRCPSLQLDGFFNSRSLSTVFATVACDHRVYWLLLQTVGEKLAALFSIVCVVLLAFYAVGTNPSVCSSEMLLLELRSPGLMPAHY